MKRALAWMLIVPLVAPACSTLRVFAEDEAADKTSYWMKKKLEYSQAILSGLVSKDFDAVRKSARSMDALNHLEKWARANTKEYRTQLRQFHDANEKLIQQADEENLDAAAIAYLQLTVSCVDCHKLVRDKPQ